MQSDMYRGWSKKFLRSAHLSAKQIHRKTLNVYRCVSCLLTKPRNKIKNLRFDLKLRHYRKSDA